MTAGLIATDRDTSLHISNSLHTQNRYVSFSNYGIAAFAGGTAALYLWGHFTDSDQRVRRACWPEKRRWTVLRLPRR